jgi:uncharacterized membrane protein
MKTIRINKEAVIVFVIFLLGLFLRLMQMGSGFWHDEAASLLISEGTLFEVLNHVKGDFHPPIFYWLLNLWRMYAGNSEALIRLPFVILSSLAIPFTYLLGKKMTGSKNAGVWASVFLSVNPLHIYYSDELRMYGLATTFCVLSWLCLYLKQDKKTLVLYLISTVIGLFTFYGLWFSLVAQMIVLFNQKRYRWMIITAMFCFGLLLWWWPVLKVQLTGSTFMSSSLPGWAALSGDLNIKTLLMIPLKWVIGRLNVSDDKALLLSSLGALGYTIFVAAWALRNRKVKDVLIALFVPILIAIIISTKAPMLGYWRYIYLIPFFSILLSIGLLNMEKQAEYLNFGALFTIFLFCNLTYFMTPRYWREDWKGVSEFFSQTKSDKTVAIYTFFDTFPAAKWYLNYMQNEPVLNDLRAGTEKFDYRMTAITKGKDNIIVFDYLNDLTDRERSVKKWLDMAGFKVKGVYSFRGVGQIYEYRPSVK